MNIEFIITSLIVIATPGTGALYTLAMALGHGHRMALVAAFGCTLGIMPHMAAAILGLAAIFETVPWFAGVIRWLGIAYLVYLAYAIWNAPPAAVAADRSQPQPSVEVIRHAILINLLNPKLSIFFLAFLPQFAGDDGKGTIAGMVGLSAVFMALTFVVFAAYGVAAASVKRRVAERPAVLAGLNRLFAVAFVAMAVRLAI